MNSGTPGRAHAPSRKLVRGVMALVIVGMAVGVYVLRPAAGEDQTSPAAATEPAAPAVATAATSAPVPRLVDLGADQCVPCKMMAPNLDQLRIDYEGKLRVDFIDVWKTTEAGEPFNIKLIPTQVFQAPDGSELFRHEGFISREDILAKWLELGYAL